VRDASSLSPPVHAHVWYFYTAHEEAEFTLAQQHLTALRELVPDLQTLALLLRQAWGEKEAPPLAFYVP